MRKVMVRILADRCSLGHHWVQAMHLHNGMTVLALYDHRSNADTLDVNPGLETIALRVAFPC